MDVIGCVYTTLDIQFNSNRVKYVRRGSNSRLGADLCAAWARRCCGAGSMGAAFRSDRGHPHAGARAVFRGVRSPSRDATKSRSSDATK